MSAPYGPMSNEPFARFDPGGLCWRTSQLSFQMENLPEPSATFPRAGMTRNGCAYELRKLGHRTIANEFSLLPTPLASDFKRQNNGPCYMLRNDPPLPVVAYHFPTLVRASGIATRKQLPAGKS